MKYVLPILLVTSAGFGAEFPLYPGAVIDEQLTAAVAKRNPGGTVYNSSDAFEKIHEFYKKLGGIDKVPQQSEPHPTVKFATMTFAGKHYAVQLSWNVNDKKHGTVIGFVKRP